MGMRLIPISALKSYAPGMTIRNHIKRRLVLFLAPFVILGGLMAVNAMPASASSAQCQNVENHGRTYVPQTKTVILQNTFNQNLAVRTGCYNLAVLTTPDGYYVSGQAQDMVDVCDLNSLPQCQNDDLGELWLEYQTPGSSVWHSYWVHDQNSVNAVVQWGLLGPYNNVINGPVQNWRWRWHFSAHYKAGGVAPWAWGDYYGPAFSII
jgi:hypothetical protein